MNELLRQEKIKNHLFLPQLSYQQISENQQNYFAVLNCEAGSSFQQLCSKNAIFKCLILNKKDMAAWDSESIFKQDQHHPQISIIANGILR